MRVPVHMRLPEELLAAVDERAANLGWSRTALVERALLDFLGKRGQPPPLRAVEPTVKPR